MGYILAIDQGTTGTTAILIDDSNFSLVDKVNQEFPQIFPEPGWVEHNLNDIWGTVESSVTEVLKKNGISPNEISTIGITNQRETTCAFNSKGEPLCNAIVWQDRRTAEFCNELKSQGREEIVKEKTGLPLDPYFSGSKMRWLLKNDEKVKDAVLKNDLKFGTIDTFLLYKLTNGDSFYTEPSNASRTLLMFLEGCDWGPSLLDTFGIRKEFLPEIKDSFSNFGKTKDLSFLPDGIPITGILGDQQAALFGQAGINEGDTKCTYGTGAFMLMNTGTKISRSESGLLSTVAYKKDDEVYYALEGSCYIAGAAVQWLRDNLEFFKEAHEIEELAGEVKDLGEMEHLLFFPFFTGIGSPYWRAEAKGAIIGLTRDSSKKHLSRACLDGMALSINDLLESMKKDTGITLKELKVDGGAVKNNLLMKIQATISNLNIIRPKIIETTGYGAGLAAAIGNNQYTMEQIKDLWKEDQVFESDSNETSYYEKKKSQWGEVINKLFLN